MPQCTSPDSLYKLCLQKLSFYYTEHNCWNDEENCGPLDELPSIVVEDLFIHAISGSIGSTHQRVIWKDSWKVFLTPLVRWAYIPNIGLLEFVTERCKNLKWLSIQWTKDTDIPVQQLIELKHRYTLVDLDNYIFCNFDVYSELVLGDATSLIGLTSQRYSIGWQGYEDGLFCGLQELHVYNLDFTTDDIASILLNTPQLQIFQHNRVAGALHKIFKDNRHQLPQFKLQNIHIEISGPDHDRHSRFYHPVINSVVTLCPDLNEVIVVASKNIDGLMLSPFLRLSQIQNFAFLLWFSPKDQPPGEFFNKGIAPIIKKYSNTLRTLRLNRVTGIDMDLIARCRGLRWLEVDDATHKLDPLTQNNPLAHLQILSLSEAIYADEPILDSLYYPFLCSPALTNLALSSRMDSESLTFILQNNSFENLKMIQFLRCRGLRLEHVVTLLSLNNYLLSLEVDACRQIGEEEHANIKKLILGNRLKCKYSYDRFPGE